MKVESKVEVVCWKEVLFAREMERFLCCCGLVCEKKSEGVMVFWLQVGCIVSVMGRERVD